MAKEYSAYKILDKKRLGIEISAGEIKWFISEYLSENIPDYQMSALLMGIAINGATVEETAALTDTMLYSGKTFNFDDKTIIDKHSTGGVGDKASFVLAPITAVNGVKVPMVAGRALGFTGGTVDKVESIKGFRTELSFEEFEEILMRSGAVLMGQTADIAPADKRIYALRDVTATIESVPLITASIMSKKLAEGANGIVMDIKVGTGAFMKDMPKARELAQSIINTAKRFGKKGTALLTNMNQPLGNKVGHSLEIIESIETLKGRGPKDLTELSVQLSAYMILQAEKAKDINEAIELAQASIDNGKALEQFRTLIKNQGGDDGVIDDYTKLPLAACKTEVKSPVSGYIEGFACADIGHQLIELGGGRKTKADIIDMSVGFDFHKKISDPISEGEAILTIYHHENQKDVVKSISEKMVTKITTFSKMPIKRPDTIYEIMGDQS